MFQTQIATTRPRLIAYSPSPISRDVKPQPAYHRRETDIFPRHPGWTCAPARLRGGSRREGCLVGAKRKGNLRFAVALQAVGPRACVVLRVASRQLSRGNVASYTFTCQAGSRCLAARLHAQTVWLWRDSFPTVAWLDDTAIRLRLFLALT
jgi:hypothetical protein